MVIKMSVKDKNCGLQNVDLIIIKKDQSMNSVKQRFTVKKKKKGKKKSSNSPAKV